MSFPARPTIIDIAREAGVSPLAVSALKLTLIASLIVVAINVVSGTAIAWVLVRDSFPGKRIVNSVIDTAVGIVHDVLNDPRTDELVADVLRENVDQLRAAVQAREDARHPPPSAPPVSTTAPARRP